MTVALARAYSAGVDEDEPGERERAVEEFVHTVTETSHEEMPIGRASRPAGF